MKVKIIIVIDGQVVDAQIKQPSGLTLPSITDGGVLISKNIQKMRALRHTF